MERNRTALGLPGAGSDSTTRDNVEPTNDSGGRGEDNYITRGSISQLNSIGYLSREKSDEVSLKSDPHVDITVGRRSKEKHGER